MTTRGELQMQISQVLSTVKSQGYKIVDVIPEEMQDHFQEMPGSTSRRLRLGSGTFSLKMLSC
jgi:hypothetical protein